MARSRVMNSGLEELNIGIGRLTYRFVRPDTNHSESEVWLPDFEGFHAIIFLVSISSYRIPGKDDGNGDEFNEDVMLFGQTCNSRWLQNHPVVLLFTNMEVVNKNSAYQPLETHFPDYKGATDAEAVKRFISKRFAILIRHHSARRDIYCRFIEDARHVEWETTIFPCIKAIISRGTYRARSS